MTEITTNQTPLTQSSGGETELFVNFLFVQMIMAPFLKEYITHKVPICVLITQKK